MSLNINSPNDFYNRNAFMKFLILVQKAIT